MNNTDQNNDTRPFTHPEAGSESAPSESAPSAPTRERNYIAFISYRHLPLDKEAAERVQKKIESYTIPKEFREEFGGRKLGHAFRDEDELPTSASLTDSIYYALDHSRFLVVICTPGLPQSKWCEAEIRYFLKTHDRDHVLAVLADGQPEESFSPYLLHEFDEEGNILSDFEPLAANIAGPGHTINKKALNKEMVRLYASFIGCPFDSLWQREKRARTNRLLSIAGLAIAILCVFLGVVLNRNARIEEQNVLIAEQNTELQSRLSSVLVDSGITKLGSYDIIGALHDALGSMESGDPAIYDHRVGKLMSDTLCAYNTSTLRSSIVYEQSTGIRRIGLAHDKAHLLVLDDVGVLRCLDLGTYDVLWELPTNSKSTELYADLPSGRVIFKSVEGVFCVALEDGSMVWSHPRTDLFGNNFQALSPDGTLFAVIDANDAGGMIDLVFLRAEDGSELGRVDLADDEDFAPSITYLDDYYAYAAAFSDDNSRFAFGIPGKDGESNGDCDRFYIVNMDTLTKELIGTTGSKYRTFYGIDVDQKDDSVFFAAYTMSTLYTVTCTKGADGYEFIERHETHSYSSPGGFVLLTDYFDGSSCRFLSNKGRIYIFSDNQMFIYSRADNELNHNYSMTGAIINAYWTDKDKGVLEVVTDDSYIIDYYMVYSEDKILSGIQGEKADQAVMTRICPAGNASIAENGSYYNTSSEAPGRLYLVEFVSDPNAERFHPSTAGSDFRDNYDFLIRDTSDLGYLFHDKSCASTFDKRTGQIVRSAKFDDYLTADHITVVDREHFLSGRTLYSMDGTTEEYGELIDINMTGGFPFYHIPLSDGQLLSYNKISLFGYHRDDGSGSILSAVESPTLCAVWLDGKPVSSLCDPNRAALFFDDSRDNAPVVSAGSNGLLLVRGRVAELKGADQTGGSTGAGGAGDGTVGAGSAGAGGAGDGGAGDGTVGAGSAGAGTVGVDDKAYTVRDSKELCFIDAVAETVAFAQDMCPDSGAFKPDFAHEKHLCATAYDDGTVCIYDADRAASNGAGGSASSDAGGSASSDAGAPVHKYNADEVANLCFSDDDAYLLVLTFAGQLDVYEVDDIVGGSVTAVASADNASGDASGDSSGDTTEGTTGDATGAEPVYSKKSDVFRKNSSLLSSKEFTAKTAGNSSLLFVSVYTSCLVLEKGYWTEISEFEGTNPAYDPATERVYFMISNYSNSAYDSSDIISYPVYDISKLRKWAETEIR